jgi:F-box/leucine-rich repeat protein 5
MPPKFDEVDVFSIPHSRMKILVRSCSEKVDITDFTNNDELMRCLNTLYGVFKEFKSHEEIENECIMMRLKKKLRVNIRKDWKF